MSKTPTIINDNYGTTRVRIRETAVIAASRVYRDSAPTTEDGRKNVVKLAQQLEEFILKPDE